MLIEEAQLRLPTPQTSAVESASEAEIHSGARPKCTPESPLGPHKWKLFQSAKPARIRKWKPVLHC